MAIIRKQDLKKLGTQERESKLKDLKNELVRAQVTAHKATAKTKEIKRPIARLLTFTKFEQEAKK